MYEMPKKKDSSVQRAEDHEVAVLKCLEEPLNHLQWQMVLAVKLYERDHAKESLDLTSLDDRNKVMEYCGSSGYSDIFRRVHLHHDFPVNAKVRGDWRLISLDELDRYRQDPALIEEEFSKREAA